MGWRIATVYPLQRPHGMAMQRQFSRQLWPLTFNWAGEGLSSGSGAVMTLAASRTAHRQRQRLCESGLLEGKRVEEPLITKTLETHTSNSAPSPAIDRVSRDLTHLV
jgi:hypothetical protein